jgi:hypothetical protein
MDKLVRESEEILVYFSTFYFITCSDVTGEYDTRDSNQMDGSSQH